MHIRPQKKKTLFVCFFFFNFILGDFYFFSLLKLCKISHFWSKSKKIWLTIFENNWKSFFPKLFSKKRQILKEILVFFRGISFATLKEKKYLKENVPTNQPYLEGPPACNTGFLSFFSFFFFFFVALCWNLQNIFWH